MFVPAVEIVAASVENVEELVRLNARLFLEDAGIRDPHTETSCPVKHGRKHFLGPLSRNDAVCLLVL